MARPAQRPTKRPLPDHHDGFDVTVEQVIGHVTFGDGDHSPEAAAFLLIAEQGADATGTYRFPGPSAGETVQVTVERLFPEGRSTNGR